MIDNSYQKNDLLKYSLIFCSSLLFIFAFIFLCHATKPDGKEPLGLFDIDKDLDDPKLIYTLKKTNVYLAKGSLLTTINTDFHTDLIP